VDVVVDVELLRRERGEAAGQETGAVLRHCHGHQAGSTSLQMAP
jgi:hypothetical protein